MVKSKADKQFERTAHARHEGLERGVKTVRGTYQQGAEQLARKIFKLR